MKKLNISPSRNSVLHIEIEDKIFRVDIDFPDGFGPSRAFAPPSFKFVSNFISNEEIRAAFEKDVAQRIKFAKDVDPSSRPNYAEYIQKVDEFSQVMLNSEEHFASFFKKRYPAKVALDDGERVAIFFNDNQLGLFNIYFLENAVPEDGNTFDLYIEASPTPVKQDENDQSREADA